MHPFGSIESPGYPNDYLNNMDCVWTIKAPKGNRVQISFTAFNIYYENETACTNDYLQIQDRNYNDFVLNEVKYCSNVPNTYKSNGEIVIIRYVFFYNICIYQIVHKLMGLNRCALCRRPSRGP